MPRPSRISLSSSVGILTLVTSIASAQGRPTDSLGWLTGCWERRTPSSVVEEHWSPSNAGTLLGFSRTVRRDTVVEYEFLRLYSVGDTLVYEAHPSRQARTEFRAIPPFEPEIVFTNPTHDFPTKVVYRRSGTDSLVARIEGMRGGQLRTISFPFRRVSCP
jgi:hypothetical protein